MTDEAITKLKDSTDDQFFQNLENCVGFKIPKDIKTILQFNYYNSAITLSKFDDNSIKDMEETMRFDFNASMIADGEPITNYLCRFSKNQTNFKFIGGQVRLINTLAEYCRNIYDVKTNEVSVVGNKAKPPSLQDMMKELHEWMLKKGAFTEILNKELSFKVHKSTFSQKPNGSISYEMKCPLQNCKKNFTISYKSYPTYYERKKETEKLQKISSPKRHLAAIKTHLLNCNSNKTIPDHIDDDTDRISVDNHYNQTETNEETLPNSSPHAVHDNNLQSPLHTERNNSPDNPIKRKPTSINDSIHKGKRRRMASRRILF